MSANSSAVLTPEQWEARDYRQPARELDAWARGGQGAAQAHDSTEYVAKIGLDESASVIVMNRAHDRVLVPPPARPILAALALVDQPFGFTPADIEAVERAAAGAENESLASALRNLRDRLQALLPPST